MGNLERLWKQEKGRTLEERQHFVQCLLGALSVSVPPEVWENCLASAETATGWRTEETR